MVAYYFTLLSCLYPFQVCGLQVMTPEVLQGLLRLYVGHLYSVVGIINSVVLNVGYTGIYSAANLWLMINRDVNASEYERPKHGYMVEIIFYEFLA